jgi:SAM-dependent methyltransferase
VQVERSGSGGSPDEAATAAARADDEQFVRDCYRLILQREVDPGGLTTWVDFLAAGNWRKRVVQALVAGEEFATLGSETLQARLHRSRGDWIGGLPAAPRILDIGGSSPTVPEGAMYEMGWQGEPELLTIVDRPPDEQYHGRPRYSQEAPYRTQWGGEVRYVHAAAEDLVTSGVLDDQRFDGVFMGQVIEHLEPAAIPGVLRWIRERLAPGGWFALDTPNRAVTALQLPSTFIDPDHTWEFRANELAALLLDAGLRIESQAGLMPMPRSVESGRWEPEETYSLPTVSRDATTGYCLAFVTRAAG